MDKKNIKKVGKTKNKKRISNKKLKGMSIEAKVLIFFVGVTIFTLSNFGILGTVGNYLSGVMFLIFGLSFYLITLTPILLIAYAFTDQKLRRNVIKDYKLFAIMLICIMSLLEMFVNAGYTFTESIKSNFEFPHMGGGIIGYSLSNLLKLIFSAYGAVVILILIIIVILLIMGDMAIIKIIINATKNLSLSIKERKMQNKLKKETKNLNELELSKDLDQLYSEKFDIDNFDLDKFILENSKDSEILKINDTHISKTKDISDNSSNLDFSSNLDRLLERFEGEVNNNSDNTNLNETSDKIFRDIEEEQVKLSDKTLSEDIDIKIKDSHRKIEYKLPNIDLLTKSINIKKEDSSNVRDMAIRLKQTLDSFGVKAEISEISRGPSVTRFEIVPDIGVKVSKIVSLTDDIKLNLAAKDIRLEAPIPGKSAIGIEVPNADTRLVRFRELIESDEFRKARSKLSFCVGLDVEGKAIVADIQKMPHMLIAGSTGSGKSVCINTLIMSILYKASPDEVKLIMVDPKVVELSIYNGIPHLLIPVVTDPRRASGALNWAVSEMEKRYKMFAKEGVKDIFGYNEAIKDNEDRSKLPQIVIIIDELADLMMVASNEVEAAICRLAQLARACGIHLIIATQRPSVNVITGLIKANIPSRIAFAVSSGVDSRTILDMNGAEKLLGKGDMLFYPAGTAKPLRIQGAFIDEKEVSRVVESIADEVEEDVYIENIKKSLEESTLNINQNTEDLDDYFEEAAKLIVESNRASIGLLQRLLRIGFNRASRIMDQLHAKGIVGPDEGTKPRKVLVDERELIKILDKHNMD